MLSALCQNAFKSKDWRSSITTEELWAVAIVTSTSNDTMIAKVKHSLAGITSAHRWLAKYRLFQFLGY